MLVGTRVLFSIPGWADFELGGSRQSQTWLGLDSGLVQGILPVTGAMEAMYTISCPL